VARAVICDDDSVLRAAVTDICQDVGLEVVAETDQGAAALELIRRFEVDVLVLDRSLPDMSGEQVLRELQVRDQQPPEVVVFTAYQADPYVLVELGARDVVEKPDFGRLADVLTGVVLSLQEADKRAREERRQHNRRVDAAPDIRRTEAGIAVRDDLLTTGSHTVPGDSVLLVAPLSEPGRRPSADQLGRIGTLLRATVRIQDVVHEWPDADGFVAVLRGGDASAAEAVWQRVVNQAVRMGLPELHGTWAEVGPLGMVAAVERAEDALIRSLRGEPGPQPANEVSSGLRPQEI